MNNCNAPGLTYSSTLSGVEMSRTGPAVCDCPIDGVLCAAWIPGLSDMGGGVIELRDALLDEPVAGCAGLFRLGRHIF